MPAHHRGHLPPHTVTRLPLPPLSTVTGMAVAMPDAGCGGGSTSSGGDGVG